jgi:hypothetical protein
VVVVDGQLARVFASIRRIGGTTGGYFADALWRLRGWLAQRPVADAEAADLSTFTYSSVIEAPAAAAFEWHEQPGALAVLTPAGLVRITKHEGGFATAVASLCRLVSARRASVASCGTTATWQAVDSATSRCTARSRCGGTRTCLNRLVALKRFIRPHRVCGVPPPRAGPCGGRCARPLLALAFARRHRIVRASLRCGRHRVARRWVAAAAVAFATTAAAAAAHAQAPFARCRSSI